MGSISTRKNGMLFFDFRYQGVRCREYTKLADTQANQKRMKKVLAKIEAEISVGSFKYGNYFPQSKLASRFEEGGESNEVPDAKSPYFKIFAEEWFDENQVRWKRSYQKIIRSTLDCHLIPMFGEGSLCSISKSDILKFRATLAKVTSEKGRRLSNDRINHILTPLRMILDDAAGRYDFSSPFVAIKALKVQRTDVDPFSLDEVKLILERVRPDFKDYYHVRFLTGLRTGEIDGLKWCFVDFEKRQILVRETVVQGKEDSTKTPESRREVEMSQPVYEALMRQKKVSFNKSKFVFCTRTGGVLSHRNITQRIWYPLLNNLGLKKRRPYQTRHTAATLWLGAGENPEWIARQMGHTTTQMLFTVYSRYVPNLTRRDGSAMDNLLKGHFCDTSIEGSDR